jgi:hypothetical protein
VKYLTDFLVVEEGGIVKFSYSTKAGTITDENLFAGFLEAITTFFQLAIQDNIVDLNGKKTRISFYFEKGYLFVGIASINKPKANCTKELKRYAAEFERFKSKLARPETQDLIAFKAFKKIIET